MTPVPISHRVATALRLDRSQGHPIPEPARLASAVAAALAGSLAADWLVVFSWTRVSAPARGYGHFRFGDYATLTVVGILVAGASWPLVCRASSSPRWLFLRLALVVTVVLWAPDAYLLVLGQPGRDVAVLMVLHVAVAAVTYNALVRLAPPRFRAGEDTGGATGGDAADLDAADAADATDLVGRRASSLVLLVAAEFALGVATLVLVPTGRPTGWWPERGAMVYLAHALVGLPLALLAAGYLMRVRRASRLLRLSGWVGGVGVALAGVGGVLAVAHPLRLVGVALMLVGPMAAGFGYLIPTFDRLSEGAATDAGSGDAG